MKKVAYIGLFLTPSSSMFLKTEIPTGVIGWTEYCHHVTLWHKANKRPLTLSEEEIRNLPWGQSFIFASKKTYSDDKAIAFSGIVLPLKVPVLDEHQRLHITGACAPGVSPVYSNELVANRANRTGDCPSRAVVGTLGWCSGGPSWSPTSPI
mgnify:CR=1 FL=1